jgi:hypothetical protein
MSTTTTRLIVEITHSNMFSEEDVLEALKEVLGESEYLKKSFDATEVKAASNG